MRGAQLHHFRLPGRLRDLLQQDSFHFSGLTRGTLLVQVLCCEVDGILTALLQDECTMDLLFSLLQQVRPTIYGLSRQHSCYQMTSIRS